MYKSILCDLKNNVMTIKFNQPKRLNALDDNIKIELKQILEEISINQDVKAIIITGEGRGFSAGGDLDSLEKVGSAAEGRDRIKKLHEIIRLMTNMEKPIIAAVNGYAVGAGFNLALACDLIIASENAKFCQSFRNVGLIPDAGGLYFLPRLVGPIIAKELIFTAKMIDSSEALRIGIVNKVVKEECLLEEASLIAEQLAKGPLKAIAFAKNIINKTFGLDFETLLENESLAQGICMSTKDFKEGVRAFKEKREPEFKGE